MSKPQPTRVQPAARSPLMTGPRWAAPAMHDTWQISRDPRSSDDPEVWATWLFRQPPAWLNAAYAVRNVAVRLVGVPPAGDDVFDTQHRSGDEVELGMDDKHLDFRAVVTVRPRVVELTTYAVTKNRVGAAYLALIRLGHGAVVRSMLRRAIRLAADVGHNVPTRE